MNNLDFKKFVKNLKRVSLSRSERGILRNDFLFQTGMEQPKKTFYTQSQSFFLFQSFRVGVAACMVIVATSGLTVFASTHSIPGDILYPLKRSVEEPIVRAFHANSPLSKAEFELQMVEERLSEVEKLKEYRPLTTTEKSQIKMEIIAQTARAEVALGELEKNNQGNSSNKVSEAPKADPANVPQDNANATSMSMRKAADDNATFEAASQVTSSSEKKRHDRLEKIMKDHKKIVEELEVDKENK